MSFPTSTLCGLIGFGQIVNAQNVFMRDAAGQQQFLLESLHHLRIAG
jgi:hypothetical protein